MSDDYEMDTGADLISVIDEDGKEHEFEVVDAIETDDARYLALLPIYEDPSNLINDDGELVILSVIQQGDEEILATIDDDDEFNEIAEIFELRLSDLYEIELVEDNPSDQ